MKLSKMSSSEANSSTASVNGFRCWLRAWRARARHRCALGSCPSNQRHRAGSNEGALCAKSPQAGERTAIASAMGMLPVGRAGGGSRVIQATGSAKIFISVGAEWCSAPWLQGAGTRSWF